MRVGSVILLIWLVVGVIAAANRGDFKSDSTCSSVGTIAVTIIAGPLNYIGVDPHISCNAKNGK